jgi:hypothetical protein
MTQENSRTGIVTGILLILLGAAFLALQFFEIAFWSDWWPTAVIGVGLLFFIAMLVAGKAGGLLAIPGSIIVMVGLILLFHNMFGFWQTWAYAWTLIVFAAGIGISIFGRYTNQEKVTQSGGVVTRLGLVLFVIFAIFFELFVGLSGLLDGSSILWPLLLILFGFYWLLARAGLFSALFGRRKPARPAPAPVVSQVETPAEAPSQPPFSEPLQDESDVIELPAGDQLQNWKTGSDQFESSAFPSGDVEDTERPTEANQE